MIGGMLKRVFGSSNDRYVKSIGKIVDQINAALAQLRVACPIHIQTDAPSVALGLFDLLA